MCGGVVGGRSSRRTPPEVPDPEVGFKLELSETVHVFERLSRSLVVTGDFLSLKSLSCALPRGPINVKSMTMSTLPSLRPLQGNATLHIVGDWGT